MRGFRKFSFRNKWHVFSFFFKKRILNFKRTKWKKINSKIFYSIRQYSNYQKRFISLKFCRFYNNLKFLKDCLKSDALYYSHKFFIFFKKLKFFLISKKFKKLKRNLKYKLTAYFRKPFYFKYNYINKCLNLFFFNFTTLRFSSRYHTRRRFFFKTMLQVKASVLKYYFGCFSVKFFKKLKFSSLYNKDLVKLFVTPELRLDILLWRLKFFKSPHLAKFAFKKKLINVNEFAQYHTALKPFNKYFFKQQLHGGDIITLHSTVQYSFKKNLAAFVSSFFLPTFFEIDYYTNTVILLKDLNLNLKDLNSILKEPLNFYHFRNFIYK